MAEDLARRAIERAASGAESEDSFVELKLELPEPRKAARQIAALCNAAPGEDALWIVGAGEDGSFAPPNEELANWLAQVSKYFDGTRPIVKNYNVQITGQPVTLLHFHTILRPFVVVREDNQTEVPWRDGNSTRNAKRSELLSLLVPTITKPDFEIVEAHITLEKLSSHLNVGMEVYIIPTNEVRLAMPLHKCHVRVESNGRSFSFPPAGVSWFEPPGVPIKAPLQLIFEKPAFFGFVARQHFDELSGSLLVEDTSLIFEAGFAGSEITIILRATPPPAKDDPDVKSFSGQHPQWFRR